MRHQLASALTLAIAVIALSPSPAHAQDDADLNHAITVCGLVNLAVSTTGLTLMYLTESGAFSKTSSGAQRATRGDEARRATLLDAYLAEHPNLTRDALALGAGPAVEDLARTLQMTSGQHGTLGALLRSRRGAINALLEQPASLERGYRALALLSSP